MNRFLLGIKIAFLLGTHFTHKREPVRLPDILQIDSKTVTRHTVAENGTNAHISLVYVGITL